MRETDQEPVCVRRDSVHGDDYAHPAFGQISASRVNGTTTLYGSDFEHRAFVNIRIKRSQLCRSVSHDWHHGREQLIEVALSEAQWATFVSSLNMGDGTPCTLERVAGETMPTIPLRQEGDIVRDENRKFTAEMADKVKTAIVNVESMAKSLSGKKRNEITGVLRSLLQDLEANLPYYVESFDRHVEKGIEKAHIEIGAYMQMTLQRAGLEALTGELPLRLNTGDEDDD